MKSGNVDARGKKTMGILLMKLYYKGDTDSLAVLRRFPSHKYIIVPHFTIRFDLTNQVAARCTIVYPREHVTTEVILTADQVDFIRDTYHNPPGGWTAERWGNLIYLTRKGYLIQADNPPTPLIPLVGEGY